MTIKRRFMLLVALLGMLISFPGLASAQLGGEDLPDNVTEDDVYRVSSQMYCDVCEGVAVSNCPSPTCSAWRQEIANLLGQGYTDDEIMTRFAELYGDQISGVPISTQERNLAIYLPLVAVTLIGLAVGWRLWSVYQRGESRAAVAARAAGQAEGYQRPTPDNVDPRYLERFLRLVEDKP